MADEGFKRKFSVSQSSKALSKTAIAQLGHIRYRNKEVALTQEVSNV